MNGTVIDIPGVTVTVNPIELEDSTDMAHLISINDGKKEISITIIYGRITETTEKVRSSKQ